jgi:triphosphoribosyl-dephospho-CoA synthase
MTPEQAFREACSEELAAPKPGNVHRHADGHGMTAADFLRSAEAAAPWLCRSGAPLGQRIFEAVAATRTAVGQNTNLGVVLLCGPLLMAAEEGGPDLRATVRRVVQTADLADTEAVFAAIRLAAPGGLGAAPQYDVRDAPTVTLAVAMAAAAARDSIARQWVSGFADVFGAGLRHYRERQAGGARHGTAALGVYLQFLAAFPDSHVLRKHGAAVAEEVRQQAESMLARVGERLELAATLPLLLEWDRRLKQRRINPGTSADLTVATILAWKLAIAAGGRN